MTDLLSLWREFAGVAVSLVMAVVLQSHWRDRTKRLALVAVAALIAAGDAYFGGTASLDDPLRTFFTVFLGSQGTYLLLQRQLKALSTATDVVDDPKPAYRYDIRAPEPPEAIVTIAQRPIDTKR